MEARPVPTRAVFGFATLLVGVAAYLAVRSLALYGDGSFYLLRIIDDETVYGRGARELALVVRQTPALVGVWLGVTDTHVLTMLLGLGQLVFPAIVWVVAVTLARSSLVVFSITAITAGICTGTTALFNVGEATIAVPLAVLVAVLLWLPRPWGLGHLLLAVGAAVVMIESHEVIIFMSSVLVPWGVLRARRATSALERVGCSLVSVLAVVAILSAGRELSRRPDDPSGHELARAVVTLLPLEVYTLTLAGACLVTYLFAPLAGRVRPVLLAGATVGSGFALYGLFATDGAA